MKSRTEEKLNSLLELTLIEYTKERFLAEDEFELFSSIFKKIFQESLKDDSIGSDCITIKLLHD